MVGALCAYHCILGCTLSLSLSKPPGVAQASLDLMIFLLPASVLFLLDAVMEEVCHDLALTAQSQVPVAQQTLSLWRPEGKN